MTTAANASIPDNATTDNRAAPPDSTGRDRGRIDDIEMLRGFAIIFVLIEHTKYALIFWQSLSVQILSKYFSLTTGVDLFFAISGFVIARSLLPQFESSGSFIGFIRTTLAFWVRRIWRLWPSAWLWLLIPIGLTLVFNQSKAFGELQNNLQAALASFLNYQNFRAAALYMRHPLGVSFQYWSLSLEEQFYFLLPFFVFVFRRYLPLILGVIILAQIGLGRLMMPPIYMMIRTDAILFGVLLAIWSRKASYGLFEPKFLKANRAARYAVLAILLGLLAVLEGAPLAHFRFSVGSVALVSAILVWVASFDQNYLGKNGLLKRVMIWIGARSYGMYLIHVPTYYATREIWFRLTPAGAHLNAYYTCGYLLTAAAILFPLSDLNYRFVEQPFRKYGARLAARITPRAVEPA